MEYTYPHERQENRSNPETGQGHPQNQHLLHYQHQQYAPAHHAIQAGYPGLRLTPYMNPLQGAGTPAGLVHSQEGGLVQPPRVPPTSGSAAAAAAASSRESNQNSHEFENVLGSVMQGSSVPGHYQAEPPPLPPHSQHGIPLQQIPSIPPGQQPSPPLQQAQTHTGAGGDGYHIEDLSHNTSHSRMAASSSGGGAMNATVVGMAGRVNTTKSNSRGSTSTGRIPKKRAAPGSSPKQPSKPPSSVRAPMTQIVTPQVYHQSQQLQQVQQQQRPRERICFSKHCQTEPLFQQIYHASMQFSKERDLPEGLEFTEDEKEKKISGVVATKDFDMGVQFGPFTGEFVKEGLGCFNPNTWEVCVRGQTWYYIDGATDPNNWLYHVQYARNTEEQNMEAYQFYGDIYFRTTKPIKTGMELRVFYSQEYCTHVGFKESLNNLLYFKDADRFECRDCDNRYTNSKSLFRHIKFEHDKKKNLIPPDHIEPAKNTPPPKPKIPNLMTIKDVAAKMARDKERNAEKNKGREKPKVDKSKRFLKVKLVPLGKSAEKDEKNEKEEFACKKCRKKFPSEGHLKEHAAFHKEMKDVKPICEVCGLECKHNKALKQHQLSHNPDAYQCEICKKYFRRKGCLVYHLRHIHQTFVGEKWTRGNMKEQVTRYVGSGEEEEEEDFHPELPKDMLEPGLGSASNEQDKDQTKDKDQVQDEDQVQDKNPVKDKDPVKDKELTSRQTQDQTIDNTQKHTDESSKTRPVCEKCGEECKHNMALKQHMLSHDPTSYQCQYCDWFFKRKGCLVYHLRTKHNISVGRRWMRGTVEELLERDNASEDDSEEARLEEELRNQKRLQRLSGDPKGLKQTCKLCGKECENTRAMNQHILSHDPNSYQCQYCKWYFKRKGCLVFHLRTKHQVNIGKKWTRFEKEDLMTPDKLDKEEDEGEDDYSTGDDSLMGEDEDMEKNGTDDEDGRGEKDGERRLRKRRKIRNVRKYKNATHEELICRICGLECENSRVLKQHLISHDPNSLQCRYCLWYFRRKGCLVFHLRTKHGVNVGKKWSRGLKKELMKNSIRAKDRKALKPKNSGVQSRGNNHSEDSSTTTVLYRCKFCYKKFTRSDFCLKHEAIVHANLSRYRCRVCRKAFSSKYALQSHSHIHAGEKRFECFICKQKFNSNGLLVRHLMHHDKPDNSELVFAAIQDVATDAIVETEPAVDAASSV